MSNLRQRAAEANGNGSEVAERQPQGMTLSSRIEKLETEFARALPNGDARQLIQDALTCTRTIRNLDKAEPRSVLGALMTCAQLGLRPGVLGHAWPLPFWDSQAKCYKAQLVIGYQGYIHLAYQSLQVADIIARPVHEADFYEREYGLRDSLVHRPPKPGVDRGPIIAYYGMFRTTAGGSGFYDMDQRQILQYRDKHAPRNREGGIVGPWSGPEGSEELVGMALKTQLRQLSKYMPKSPQFATAADVDGSVRVDVTAISEASSVSSHPEAIEGQLVDDSLPPIDQDPTMQDGYTGGQP